MLDVVNLAHGSFYMLGAYAGLATLAVTGNFWLAGDHGTPRRGPRRRGPRGARPSPAALPPVAARPGAPDVRPRSTSSRTWSSGAGAGRIRSIPPPELFAGRVTLGGLTLPSYRLFVIGFGLLVAVLLWLVIEKTRLGAVIRAGVYDAEMTAGLGIDIGRVFTVVFAFGAALGGLSGVIAGPIQSAYPSMGVSVLIPALIVVVIGGLGLPEGLVRRQPHHRAGRDLREGLAARRLDADDLRRDGAHRAAPAAGPVRTAAQVMPSAPCRSRRASSLWRARA